MYIPIVSLTERVNSKSMDAGSEQISDGLTLCLNFGDGTFEIQMHQRSVADANYQSLL